MRNRTRWLLLAAVALAVAAEVAIGAQPREAARIVDVRVGRHAGFVRVVFETDVPAAFEVEGGDGRELRVRLAAESGALLVGAGGGGGPRVTVEPLASGGSLARILSAAPVRLAQQVLERPPRIVLDLRPAAAVETERPESAAPPAAEAGAQRPLPPEELPPAEETAPLAAEAPAEETAPLAAEAPAEEAAPLAAEAPAEEAAPLAAEAPVPEPATPIADATPPVSTAPPAARLPRPPGLWPLLVGAGLGLAVGLLIGLSRRRAAAVAASASPAAPPQDEPEPIPSPGLAAELVDEMETEPAPSAEVEPAVAPAAEAEPQPIAAPAAEAEPEPIAAPAAEAEPQPELSPAPAAAAATAAPALDAEFVSDLLQMLHKLDRRLARLEASFDTLREQTDRLGARSADQGEELVGQRVALTRLARELHSLAELPLPRRAAGGRG